MPSGAAVAGRTIVIVPGAVWDGMADTPHAGWAVVVRGARIEALGPSGKVAPPADAERIELPGLTLIPGLIEGHSHLFLHPYNETLWDDQVLREPFGFRMARAIAHARTTRRATSYRGRRSGCAGRSCRR